MNFDNAYTFYSEESTLQEQLNIFHHNLYHDVKDISLDQLLSAPIPTMYTPPPTYYQPSSPTSSISSGGSPTLRIEEDFFVDIPQIEIPQLPTPTTTTTINKKKSHHRKVLPPGQCTLPIRVATNKPVRPPRHLECFNCKVTKTPLWRRTPDRTQTLCNACGLYYKQYNQHRPLHIRHKPAVTAATTPVLKPHPYHNSNFVQNRWINHDAVEIKQEEETNAMISIPTNETPAEGEEVEPIIECINCQQTKTPLWRKNEQGEPLCNACGLYAKLHHRNRPVEMRKSTIQRRRRDWGDETWIHTNIVVAPKEQVIGTPAASENDKFNSMLLQMDRTQMEGYLGSLQQKCDLLRNVLN